jgi:hypothetical protein
MLGFNRIDLSILESLKSIWVVLIGLELFSLVWPGLGSDYIASFYTCAPCYFLPSWLLFPISVENWI